MTGDLGGMHTYDKYAELFQRPRVWIVESSTPLAAAVVAAPMRKLWPEYNELSKPACCNNFATNLLRENYFET